MKNEIRALLLITFSALLIAACLVFFGCSTEAETIPLEAPEISVVSSEGHMWLKEEGDPPIFKHHPECPCTFNIIEKN